MAAGLKTLELIAAPGFFERLGARTRQLASGLADRAARAGIPLATHQIGGMFGFFFSSESPIVDFAQVMACDQDRFRRFFHGMLREGIYLAPSAFEAGFVSTAHDEAILQQTLTAAERVFARI
jgi:glutamate-1-semialdehyde 2,1-aminomutase